MRVEATFGLCFLPTVGIVVKGRCEIPGCEVEDGSVRCVSLDDLLQEPDAKALWLCQPHFEKWEEARLAPPLSATTNVTLVVTRPVLYCQSCKRGVGQLDAESLADWIQHQYGMGPVVGWLCPECRKNSDEAN